MPKSNKSAITIGNWLGLEIQRFLSFCMFIIPGPLFSWLVHRRYRIDSETRDLARSKYREITKGDQRPLLICSNHLSYVDSIIQAVFLNTPIGYLKDFKTLPWNLPEKKNFYNNLLWRVICYLGKCVPVQRGGSSSQRNETMDKVSHILERGDILSIFPEGKRSRTGKLDTVDYSYAPGMILKKIANPSVLCIYMRSKNGHGPVKFPSEGDSFYFKMKLVKLDSALTGIKRARDFSGQIISHLKIMEEEYFAGQLSDR